MPKAARWRAACAALLAGALAAACGGGGDSVTLADVDATPAGEWPAPTSTVLTGSVATGAVVVDALVLARCAGGEVQGRSGTDGSFRLDLASVTPPCLLQAIGGSRAAGATAGPLHGVALSGGHAQINPLTELALSRTLGQSMTQAFASFSGQAPSVTALTDAATYLAEQLAGMGLARPVGDIFAGTFQVGDANDQLLDALQAHLHSRAATLEGLSAMASAGGDLAAYVDGDRAVAIEFVAKAGASTANCVDALAVPLGKTGTTAQLTDLRFYLSRVQLLRQDGTLVALKLAPNGPWQHTSVAGDAVTLIDLEGGRGACAREGTAETNQVLRGTVPAGRYVGVRMTLGVPEALNHSDTAAAPAPLDLFSMGWGWQAGRKFAKIEFGPAPGVTWLVPSFVVHLGSTGCIGNPGQGSVVCATPNRAVVRFDAFDPDSQRIAVDLQALLAGTDITRNRAGAIGCMSAATDPECEAVFAALGIDWRADGTGSGRVVNEGLAQTVFQVVPR